jgi:hypothetical protein
VWWLGVQELGTSFIDDKLGTPPPHLSRVFGQVSQLNGFSWELIIISLLGIDNNIAHCHRLIDINQTPRSLALVMIHTRDALVRSFPIIASSVFFFVVDRLAANAYR